MIRQPRNNSTVTWNTRFSTEWNNRLDNAQKYVDSEVLRLSTPYVPKKEGELIRSGIRNTVIGSGEVKYRTPYSRKMYYSVGLKFRGRPQRGAKWFEKFKRIHKDFVLRRARELF